MLYINAVPPSLYEEDCGKDKHVFHKNLYKAFRYSYSSVQPEGCIHLSSCNCALPVNKSYLNWFSEASLSIILEITVWLIYWLFANVIYAEADQISFWLTKCTSSQKQYSKILLTYLSVVLMRNNSFI